MTKSNKQDALSLERLKSLLHYDPVTGLFTWIASRHNGVPVGAVAGYPDEKGYIRIEIAPHYYRASRLAVFYMTGEWPTGQVDHWDRDKGNNRYANLIDVSQSGNQQNSGLRRDNKSGQKGVVWHKASSKWRAQIGHDGRRIHIGTYDTVELAAAAYASAKALYHKHQPMVLS